MTKRVLVTGGAGMIGSALAKHLGAKGHEVTVVDSLLSGSLKNLGGQFTNFIQSDLRDAEIVSELFLVSDFDEIYHLAANMGGIDYITKVSAPIMRDNLRINLNMLDAVEGSETRILFTSSACVYPNYMQKTTEAPNLKEEHVMPADPNEAYGWEKLMSEQLFEGYRKDYGVDVRVARLHNVFGACYTAFHPVKAKAPCHLLHKAFRHPNPPMVMWGKGDATRSFLYIQDCVEALELLMASNWVKPLNIGSDVAYSVNELVTICKEITGKSIRCRHDMSKPEGVKGRNADLTLAKKVLNWSPKYSLAQGLTEVYGWLKRNSKELPKYE